MKIISRSILLYMLATICTAGTAGQPLLLTTIGNSITVSQPDHTKGWSGRWGMASSAEANDYSAQLASMLGADRGAEVNLQRFSQIRIERSNAYIAPEPSLIKRARGSHFVVVELGDNVSDGDAGATEFGKRLDRLLDEVRPTDGALVCIGTWWRKAKLDSEIRAACDRHGGTFVDLSGLVERPELRGSAQATGATDTGVLSHPGDTGMKLIASAVFKAFNAKPTKRQSNVD